MVGLFKVSFRQFLTSLFVVISGVLLITPSVGWAAFGASPPFLNASHLVKGARYEQKIYLVRDNADIALPIKADLALPDTIKSWVSMKQGTSFIIPEGVRQFPVSILINVPKNAELGVYSGTVTFGSQPEESGQVTVSLGIEIPINITIGTNIHRDLKAGLIKLLDIEEGWSPRVYIKLENGGNVAERFDSASYELFDGFKDKRFAVSQKRDNFPEVPPFETEEFTVEFPVDFHLGIGQYWGSVTFYQGETPIGSQTAIFNVLKRGSLSNPANQLLSVLNLGANWIYYLGGLILLILITFIIKRKGSSKKQVQS